jgi:hypothetical protein
MQKICENLRKESAKICEKLIVTSPHHHITSSSNFQHAKNLRETHHPIITIQTLTNIYAIKNFQNTATQPTLDGDKI